MNAAFNSFIGTLVGAVVSIATAIFVEYYRRPKIKLDIETPPLEHNWEDAPRAGVRQIRFLRLIVSNETLPSFLRWMSRSPALRCRAAIAFHYFDDAKEIFQNRWLVDGLTHPNPH